MTKDKERDDAMIAEAAEMFPPDTVDVQSRYVIVHQLRASADIQDAQTKRETGWADTSDRACLMRKAADALDALLAIQATEARAQGLVDAAQTFTDRLKSIHEHPAYKSVWMVNQAHYGPYDPQYTDELEALETALATWRRT